MTHRDHLDRDQPVRDYLDRGRRAEQANGNGFDRSRAARLVEWTLSVIVQGLGVATVVGTLLMLIVMPMIEQRIALQVSAEAAVRGAYDQMIERWRIDHERWSVEKSKELEKNIELERALRLQDSAELLRVRDRLEGNGRNSGPGRGGAP